MLTKEQLYVQKLEIMEKEKVIDMVMTVWAEIMAKYWSNGEKLQRR